MMELMAVNQSKPSILLTNDDGIDSPHLKTAAEVLRPFCRNLVVVAPDRERSASGHAITMHAPLRVNALGADRFSVSGTPADCVYLGVAALLEARPDFVVSGPNRGPNLGTDVFYSGTVAAAAEAVVRGLMGIALSTPRDSGPQTWEMAARFVGRLLTAVYADGPFDGLLNINTPQADGVQGYRWTRLGRRRYREDARRRTDPKGRDYYWIGGPGITDFQDASGEDVSAVQEGYISITPLHLDMTSHSLLETLRTKKLVDQEIRTQEGEDQ
jgi:5'-nucleotidase